MSDDNLGEKLNKRVWSLFQKAGFKTLPNSQEKDEYRVDMGRGRPLDLFAEIRELGVKIIGSNKSGGIKGSWTAHMNDCESLREVTKAQKCLLVATDHDLDPVDLEHAKKLNMPIWSEEHLMYYEELVESIGEYAKYEIIHSLGINTTEEKDIHKVLAIKLNQPTNLGDTEIFVFSMSPERLLRTSVIYRKAQGNSSAYQRMLNKKRLPKIAKFLETPGAILPTDIILHLDHKVRIEPVDFEGLSDVSLSGSNNYKLVALNIPMAYASTEIIDGQHRLYAFTKTSEEVRKKFNLVVVAIQKLTEKQKREAFIAINDNSKRMDANLVAYLKYTNQDEPCKSSPEIMAIRVAVELNKQLPFKKLIKLLDIGKEKLTLKGISGYDLKDLLGPKGLLRKYNQSNDPDEYVRMLRRYFSLVKSEFKTEWNSPDKYIIATNRGVTALLKLLRSIIKHEEKFPDDNRFKEYLKALKKYWTEWETVKLKESYVGSQGWKRFHKDMVNAIRSDNSFYEFSE